MIKNYKETRGVLVKKYRGIFGQYVFVMDENGAKTKVHVGKMIFEDAEIGTKWTIGQMGNKLVNIRPGFCKSIDE